MKMTRIKRWGILVLLVLILASLAAWNFTEPWTMAYEINPMTLEVRYVEFLDRPITGRADFKIRVQKQMAIGRWLTENGHLMDEEGYWVLFKSYNPRRGFLKGEGQALRQQFDVAGIGTPMPHPDVESENKQWVEFVERRPKRATWIWQKYRELAATPDQLWQAAFILDFVRLTPDEMTDEEFKAALENEMN